MVEEIIVYPPLIRDIYIIFSLNFKCVNFSFFICMVALNGNKICDFN